MVLETMVSTEILGVLNLMINLWMGLGSEIIGNVLEGNDKSTLVEAIMAYQIGNAWRRNSMFGVNNEYSEVGMRFCPRPYSGDTGGSLKDRSDFVNLDSNMLV